MRLDTFVDLCLQPQQDAEVVIEVNGELVADLELVNVGSKLVLREMKKKGDE